MEVSLSPVSSAGTVSATTLPGPSGRGEKTCVPTKPRLAGRVSSKRPRQAVTEVDDPPEVATLEGDDQLDMDLLGGLHLNAARLPPKVRFHLSSSKLLSASRPSLTLTNAVCMYIYMLQCCVCMYVSTLQCSGCMYVLEH